MTLPDRFNESPQHSQPITIVRIITRLNIGGPARHAVALSTGLANDRFRSVLVTGPSGRDEGDYGPVADSLGVHWVVVPELRRAINPWHDAVALWKLVRVIWREHPRIVHTHMAKAGTLGRFAGLLYNRLGRRGRPRQHAFLIHTFHGHVLEGYFSPWLSRFFVTIERWLARHTDCLIAVSGTIRDQLLEKGIGRREQWRVIPLGLDLSPLAELPLPERSASVRFGMVGRLVPIKNPQLFLEALQRLRVRLKSPIQGTIIGDGPLRHDLEREVERLGLSEVVRLTGWQHDLRTIYEGLEVACLTSWNEGTPVALIEAMAAGRAVVATDVGGVRDLLDDSQSSSGEIAPGAFQLTPRGLLVRSGDPVGLANALVTLERDPALRRRLGQAARAHVIERYTHERLIADMTALYEDLQQWERG